MTTINDIEREIARAVDQALVRKLRELGILPVGYRCAVRLQGPNRDKKRNADFERNWDVDDDSIRIEFEEIEAGNERDVRAEFRDQSPDPMSDLLRALHRAESRPGYDFVSLKFFRDTALPSEGFAWAGDSDARHSVISEAIERRLVLTHKVPNPKSPQFPVTSIRLNMTMPEVQRALGTAAAHTAVFRPVAIRGEPLSATVLRDRR
jgi:hypothetical protein